MGKLNLAALTAGLSVLLVPTLAQSTSTTVTLHLPGFDAQTIFASVITANPTATSYFLACPTNVDSTECGLGQGINVLDGPSTLEVHMTMGDYSSDTACTLKGDEADCDETEKSAGNLKTVVNHFSGVSQWDMPVTVTAGLEALAAATAATTSSGSSSQTTITSGSAGASSTPAATGSGTAGSSSTSRTSTAGVAVVTAHAVVAGVAAVFGGMFMV